MKRDSVDTRLEYLLYRLERTNPEVLKEAEQFTPAMLTSDRIAGDRARSLAHIFAAEHVSQFLETVGASRP